MEETVQAKRADVDLFEGADEETEPFEVYSMKDNSLLLGYIYLKNVKQPIFDTYRDLRNGDGRKQGNKAKAREYLLKRCYATKAPKEEMVNVGFEFVGDLAGVELNLDKYKAQPTQRAKEIAFFIDAAKTTDAALIAWMGRFFPDVHFPKSGSGGEDDPEG
jgi:hypothetical protein